MIANNNQNKQLPNEKKSTFKELQILKHLRKAGLQNLLAFHVHTFLKSFFA